MTEIISREDKRSAGAIHLWIYAAIVFPVGTLFALVALFGGVRHPNRFVRHHAAQALNFVLLIAAVFGVLFLPLIIAVQVAAFGSPLGFLIVLAVIGMMLAAPWPMRSAARNGEWAHYPLYLPVFKVANADSE